MKKKNLEKAIILGLILSTGVYGTAWADIVGIKTDGTEEIIEKPISNPAFNHGGLFIDYNYPELGDDILSEYKTIKITVGDDAQRNFNGVFLTGYILKTPNTDFNVTLTNSYESGDGIYLSNEGADSDHMPVYFEIGNYNANISAPNSNAFTMSTGCYSLNEDEPKAIINGHFLANVENGNGIVVGASTLEHYMENKTSSLTIIGNSNNVEVPIDITINANKLIKIEKLPALDNLTSKVEYDPAAIYAGDTEYNFILDSLEVDGFPYIQNAHYDRESFGKAAINLIGDARITINDEEENQKAYGIYAGKMVKLM